ncbi:TrkA family potassium uptake protein [Alkalibacter rhizosphaerae]|uniref:TrkA family potassium uptake protein n=1 Tax=Alkalibacter rhizosphaerae TaxID=2815577 RepID=A0A974XN62_9FIRM|nr:TrkA family potassium uptake protein [Alkalibacter rhizosphaerae]QSX08956.1 TrkA family potassium uptake protein [Alkalibacter rhizosphaerae]
MKQFAVLGLGRFGYSLATKLYEQGYDVLAIDKDEEIIKGIADLVTFAVQADSTDISTLRSIGLKNIDVAVVSIASDIHASLMTVLHLQDLGIKEIYAKAQNEQHAKVLQKIGVEKVFLPERDMGRRVAQHIASSNILDLIELDPTHSVQEILVPKSWNQKTLTQLDLRARYGVNVIAIKRESGIVISPAATDPIFKEDVLIVVGENSDLIKLQGLEK